MLVCAVFSVSSIMVAKSYKFMYSDGNVYESAGWQRDSIFIITLFIVRAVQLVSICRNLCCRPTANHIYP